MEVFPCATKKIGNLIHQNSTSPTWQPPIHPLAMDDCCETPQLFEKKHLQNNHVDYNMAVGLGNVPVRGMQFLSEEEGYEFYYGYAKAVGFSIRKFNKYVRPKDKKLMWRIFCCSCEGKCEKHSSGTPNKPRPQTRFDCKARIKIELNEKLGVYEITMHSGDHSHDLVPPNIAYMLRSHRFVRPAQKELITSMADSGIGSTDIFHHFSNQAGGYEKLNFSQADCDNIVQKRRKDFLKIDSKNQIRNVFWCDAKMRIDYEQFGDVVCFDTTYKTNEYDMPFAPIVGVNHHRQTVIFASALLSDETTETFVWVFERFMEAMGGKKMKVIFTDQAMAICNAIKQVFPDTHHRLCIWHIYQNALRNLSHVFSKFETFNADFMKCIYEAEVEEDFLAHWSQLLEKYDLKKDKWLNGIFLLREKWAQVYGRQHFCVGMAKNHLYVGPLDYLTFCF
ncbi:hypothetical protein ACHQM5_013424 [Ranunculus cassubicifolius]